MAGLGFFLKHLILGLFLSPGMVFILGWTLESRTVPIWKYQSKAFIPGDLGIALTFAAMATGARDATFPARFPISATAWPWAVAVFAVAVIVIMRHRERRFYHWKSHWSATKLWHDVAGYGVLVGFLVYFLPFFLTTTRVELRIMASAGVFIWICGALADSFTDPEKAKELAEKRHPSDWWQPTQKGIVIFSAICILLPILVSWFFF